MTDDPPEEPREHYTWPDVAMGFLTLLAVTWPFVLACTAGVLIAFATGGK